VWKTAPFERLDASDNKRSHDEPFNSRQLNRQSLPRRIIRLFSPTKLSRMPNRPAMVAVTAQTHQRSKKPCRTAAGLLFAWEFCEGT
jgi:hypothetical protein